MPSGRSSVLGGGGGRRLLRPLRIESGGNRKFTNPEFLTTKWLYPKAIGVLLANESGKVFGHYTSEYD